MIARHPAGRTPYHGRRAVAARARGRRRPAGPDAGDVSVPVGDSADRRRRAEEIERSDRPVLALIGTAG
ncbi:hypothetical protein AB0C02_14295 [Micromonospora sp. NPDC048999]|uniref:hypothetical protein n=1 Tax=Micromonospora sp. NPDC048999 TaxID=3155391 RepID=UPI0033DD62AB